MKNRIALTAGVLLLFLTRFLPVPGLSSAAVQLLGILAGAVILWLFVGIDWPSVLVLAALSLVPSVGTGKAVLASFGSNTIAFLFFSFLLTFALSDSGALKRLALYFITRPFAKKGVWHFVWMYLCAVMLIGAFIAPTLTFLLFFALHTEVCNSLREQKGGTFGKLLMVGTACATSISCGMTPVAHTFPLMAIGYYEKQFEQTITYAEYLKYGLPIGLSLFVLLFIWLYTAFHRKKDLLSVRVGGFEAEAPGPFRQAEKRSLAVFLSVVVAWIATGLFPTALKPLKALTTTFPAMIGVALMALIRADGKPLLNLKEGITRGVSWPSLLICGAALALGQFFTSEQFGIPAVLSGLISPVLSGLPPALVLLVLIGAICLMTNLMSNIVTTTLMYSVAMSALLPVAGQAADVSPKLVAILIGMCASFAYATPPAIAHIAIAASSDYATPKDMLKTGGLMAVLSAAVAFLFTILLPQTS